MEMLFKIERVKAGMKLAKAARNPRTNSIVAPAGIVLNSRSIEILNSNGITEIDIELSEEEMARYNNPNAAFLIDVDNGIPTTLSPKKVAMFKKAISPLRKGKQLLLNVQDVISSAYGVKVDITNPQPNPYAKGKLSYKLSSYAVDKSASDAAVRISTYATMVANAYNKQGNISRDKLIDEQEIALAALLHNYGSVCENDEVRLEIAEPLKRYFPKLRDRDIEEITSVFNPKYIPIYSYILLRDKPELFESSVIKAMILNSRKDRKMVDRLGNKQMVGDTRSVMGALIISLCALYDETLTKSINCTNGVEEVDRVLSEAFYSDKYDRSLIDLFRQCIPLYPVGTKVEIFNDNTYQKEYAVVIDNSARKENYKRPIVLTVPGNETIDLSKTTRSRILGLVSDSVEYSTMNLNNANNSSLTLRKRK